MKIAKIAKFIILILFCGSSLSYSMNKPSYKDMSIHAKKLFERMLIQSTESGDINVVKQLLDLGVDPNAKDLRGWTALMYAAEKGFFNTVKVLLRHGALISIKDDAGNNVIDILKRINFRRNRLYELDNHLLPDVGSLVCEYVDLHAVYEQILQFLEQTLKDRIEKRNKRIQYILHESNFGVPINDLQDLISGYALEDQEVEGSGENYALKK